MVRRAVLAALALGTLFPGVARATLVFEHQPAGATSVWAAADDGSGAHRLASGSTPRISPDGRTVAYQVVGNRRTYRPDLMIVPAAGGAPRVLVRGWWDPATFAWSPDGRTIAAVTGPELGPQRLALVDVATGAQRTLARGWFAGAGFSPDGSQLLYARAAHEPYPYASDVYRAVTAGGAPVRVTSDHVSQWPLWGPRDTVVFVRLVDAKRRRYGPKSELYLMAPDGSGVRRLTRTKVDPLLFGLTPTAWSADGTRLLAEFGGQDTSYAETVDPATGAHHPVVRATESGFVGTDLSADGTTILGATGGDDPGSRHDVVTIPWAGGPPTVLVRNAFDPDWNR